jgi:hypothetical protein
VTALAGRLVPNINVRSRKTINVTGRSFFTKHHPLQDYLMEKNNTSAPILSWSDRIRHGKYFPIFQITRKLAGAPQSIDRCKEHFYNRINA